MAKVCNHVDMVCATVADTRGVLRLWRFPLLTIEVCAVFVFGVGASWVADMW